MTGHHSPQSPAHSLANGIVWVQPAAVHFDVAVTRRRDGRLRVRITRTAAGL